jgi:Domain of unknown function (DUF1841)
LSENDTPGRGPDREQLRAHRQVFWDAWQKAQADLPLDALQVRIARVIALHPEYHHFFDDLEDFLERDFAVDAGMNPYLHLSLHLALEEQVAIHQPPEVAGCLEFLMLQKGMSRHDALHVILEVLAETVYFAQRRGDEPDVQAYVAGLRALMQE